MHLSTDQFERIGQNHLQARVLRWQARADQALPPAQRHQPPARLNALADAVVADQGDTAALAAEDVRVCAQWLARALEQGTPWNETRAVALLHAAAALGVMWFVDGRLLLPEQQLPVQTSLDAAVSTLLREPQGRRYAAAAARDEDLQPALRAMLHQALSAGPEPALLERMARAAFDRTPVPGESEWELDGEERLEGEPDLLDPLAEQFLTRERGLLAQAGVADARLAAWCTAGDLCFGQGRCARLLATSPSKADPEAAIAWLKETLVDYAEFQ